MKNDLTEEQFNELMKSFWDTALPPVVLKNDYQIDTNTYITLKSLGTKSKRKLHVRFIDWVRTIWYRICG